MKDKLFESEILNLELSVPEVVSVTLSPSASEIEISKTLLWPFVTSTLVSKSTKIGALSLRLLTTTDITDVVIGTVPSVAETKKL